MAQAADVLSPKTEIAVIGQGKTNEALQAIDKADYVIPASYLFRNAASQFGWTGFQTLIEEMNRRNKRYALLSLGNAERALGASSLREARA